MAIYIFTCKKSVKFSIVVLLKGKKDKKGKITALLAAFIYTIVFLLIFSYALWSNVEQGY